MTANSRLYSMAAATLAGKTALVTGATGGIGGAIALELARRGARLVVTGRDKAKLKKLTQQIDAERPLTAAGEPLTSQSLGIPCDIRDTSLVVAMAKEARARAGTQIDILVNAAGVSRDGLLFRLSEPDLMDTLRTNLVSAMMLSKELAPSMIRQKSGVIVNVSSVIGLHGNTGQSAYAASKAGLVGFTKALAKELGPRGVRVNAIAPGFIDTELTRHVLEQPLTQAMLSKAPLPYPDTSQAR
ncbi:hypothetical protein IWW38_001623 [Coemansia aciculifera]|uniref:Uncharacterized protein n=1 Tax=Coemansia aciculifera TaxID=417176 RepID=A0ACC1M6T0_9FUNG|nr:hypothetical protein IWW38_001623 [Coemansia aciculifera]